MNEGHGMCWKRKKETMDVIKGCVEVKDDV